MTLGQKGGKKIRYAVVGLGWFAQAAALPAFDEADNSELVALVSDDPKKREELSQEYHLRHTYSYEEYETCLTSGHVDAVYIALPNHLHCDFTVRAAKQGIHVLCEKPMAITDEECETMIQAAEENGIKLMIAYRLHLEEANLQAIEIVRSGQIGEPRIFNSLFTQQVEEGNIRLQKALGGGVIDDIGIYCINASRYLFRDEPYEVFAMSANNGESRFREVEEMVSATLRFPQERLATFTCSFGAASTSTYQIVGTKGDLRVNPAYTWHGGPKHYLTIDGETQEQSYKAHDQLAAEFTYFSKCILENRDPEPSGREGWNDVRIIRALYESIETGQPVRIRYLDYHKRPSADQTIKHPANEEQPELIRAADPSGKS